MALACYMVSQIRERILRKLAARYSSIYREVQYSVVYLLDKLVGDVLLEFPGVIPGALKKV
jgi:hypothetical protein